MLGQCSKMLSIFRGSVRITHKTRPLFPMAVLASEILAMCRIFLGTTSPDDSIFHYSGPRQNIRGKSKRQAKSIPQGVCLRKTVKGGRGGGGKTNWCVKSVNQRMYQRPASMDTLFHSQHESGKAGPQKERSLTASCQLSWLEGA